HHARVLGIFVSKLDELLAPLGVEGGDWQADQGAIDDRIDAEVGLADRLFDRAHLSAVPHLHGDGLRIGSGDGRHLVDRHALAVDVDDDRIKQVRAGTPGTQPLKLLLERLDGAAHAPPEVIQVKVAGGILSPLPLRAPYPALANLRPWRSAASPRGPSARPARGIPSYPKNGSPEITVASALPRSTLSRLPGSSIENTITGRLLSRARAMAAPSMTLRS